MRHLWILALLAAGCASSIELRDRAETHVQLAHAAAERGDWERARVEQGRAERLYEQAAARAWRAERNPPPPPPTTPPLPLRSVF
jgi:hypothetical protein